MNPQNFESLFGWVGRNDERGKQGTKGGFGGVQCVGEKLRKSEEGN